MSSLEEEIETIKFIYPEELEIDPQEDSSQPVKIHVKVKPNDESGTSSFIKVNFTFPTNYPEVSPTITITNPRGISDGSCKTLMRSIEEFVSEKKGDLIIFDVLQLCNDFIVQNQQQDETNCDICFDLLSLKPVITTLCDHYLHEDCFKTYVTFRQKDLIEKLEKLPKVMQNTVELTLHCPVCRAVLDENLSLEIERKHTKKSPKKNVVSNEKFEFDWTKWRREQAKMNEIFEKQKKNGGIIDEDEEKLKNVITAETTVELPLPTNAVGPDVPEETTSASSSSQSDSIPNKTKYPSRNYYRGRGQRSKYPRNN